MRRQPLRQPQRFGRPRQTVLAGGGGTGHHALADFASRHPGRLTLITQNVDGLHQRAGLADTIALHGSLLDDHWLDPPRPCCHTEPLQAGEPVCAIAQRERVSARWVRHLRKNTSTL